jgi:hypothetical protein
MALSIYLLFTGIVAIWLLLDTWANQFTLLAKLFPQAKLENLDLGLYRTLAYTVAGTIIGGVVISFRGLQEHAALRHDFQVSFVGSYIIGPWAAALLGIAMYGLIRSGLFILGGVGNIEGTSPVTNLGYLGIGFLIGFAWNQVLEKLDSLAHELFRPSPEVQRPMFSTPPSARSENRSAQEESLTEERGQPNSEPPPN